MFYIIVVLTMDNRETEVIDLLREVLPFPYIQSMKWYLNLQYESFDGVPDSFIIIIVISFFMLYSIVYTRYAVSPKPH